MLENKPAIIPAPQKCDRESAIATESRQLAFRAAEEKRQETGCDVACGPLGRRGRYHRSNRRLPRPRRPPAGGERWAARSGGRSIIWTRHARRVRRDAIRRAPDRDAVQRARESVADVDWRVFKIPHPHPPLSPPPGRRLGARVNERSCERAPRCLSDIYRSAETVHGAHAKVKDHLFIREGGFLKRSPEHVGRRCRRHSGPVVGFTRPLPCPTPLLRPCKLTSS